MKEINMIMKTFLLNIVKWNAQKKGYKEPVNGMN